MGPEVRRVLDSGGILGGEEGADLRSEVKEVGSLGEEVSEVRRVLGPGETSVG